MVATLTGYAAAVLIGLSLGLTGGGGSILTVPILVYIFNFNPVLATAYSLFVVGSTSLVGSISYMQKGLVARKAALIYGLPSFVAVFLTRTLLVPAIPDPIIHWGSFTISRDMGIMVFFATVMLAAAVSMIRSKQKETEVPDHHSLSYPLLALQGALMGVVTGIVGAGGGFLIVPALVLLAKLPMKIAIGTSLVIIAANSLIGFLGDVSHRTIDWAFLLSFTALSVLGIFAGSYLSGKINGDKLKQGFGWFVLTMGILIIIKELFL